LLKEWNPDPLVPKSCKASKPHVMLSATVNGFVDVAGCDRPKLNMTSYDFLGKHFVE